MKCAAVTVALLAAAVMVSVSAPHAGAHRPLAIARRSHAATLQKTDTWPPTPQTKHASLAEILTLDGPFRAFLGYLKQTNLVEVFQNQAYLTDQGITIFVPVDRAFAAIKPPALSSLSMQQLKSLMMYHSLGTHYELADFERLSQTGPVTTLAGGQYTVNVTFDAGTVHVRSRWADAKIVGSVSVDEPMAIYELDRVLLPDTLFRAQPPVAATAAPLPSNDDSGDPATEPDPVVTAQYGSPEVSDVPVSACGDDDRFACYAAAAAIGVVMALVGW